MAYTQSDYDNVKSAAIALASGTSVVRVTTGGKSVEYAQRNLGMLRELLSEIKTEITASAGTPSFFLTSTSKGL